MSFTEAMALFDVFDGVVIPEPATLLWSGVAALLLRRRRKQRYAIR